MVTAFLRHILYEFLADDVVFGRIELKCQRFTVIILMACVCVCLRAFRLFLFLKFHFHFAFRHFIPRENNARNLHIHIENVRINFDTIQFELDTFRSVRVMRVCVVHSHQLLIHQHNPSAVVIEMNPFPKCLASFRPLFTNDKLPFGFISDRNYIIFVCLCIILIAHYCYSIWMRLCVVRDDGEWVASPREGKSGNAFTKEKKTNTSLSCVSALLHSALCVVFVVVSNACHAM